jgi:hypothetical protein
MQFVEYFTHIHGFVDRTLAYPDVDRTVFVVVAIRDLARTVSNVLPPAAGMATGSDNGMTENKKAVPNSETALKM